MQYIIFDLEATCWETRQERQAPSEIIEIGAVKLTGELEQDSIFQTFVRPVNAPVLSPFCSALTSISQGDVDGAPEFFAAMQQFEAWMGLDAVQDTMLLSWGRYDKKQLTEESARKSYSGAVHLFLARHRSLKHDYAAMKNIRLCGMQGALYQLGLPLVGTHHRGIDDARNIAEIFKCVYPQWSMWLAQQEEQV